MLCRLFGRAVCALLASAIIFWQLPGQLSAAEPSQSDEQRLARGEVVVALKHRENIKFVFGRIWIDEEPQRVWQILANPFEFEGRICPRVKRIDVLVDRPDRSVMQMSVNVCWPIPRISYVVESRYDPGRQVTFRRVSGLPKVFKGYWQIKPLADGTKTEVTYGMYVHPGIPVPEWIVREGVKVELPKVLVALRERVKTVYVHKLDLEPRSILAAATEPTFETALPDP